MNREQRRRLGLGATGEFPDGKSGRDDEGELRFAVFIRDGLIRMEFGKPVAWFSMKPGLAREMAATLLKLASELEES